MRSTYARADQTILVSWEQNSISVMVIGDLGTAKFRCKPIYSHWYFETAAEPSQTVLVSMGTALAT
eukprot:SAG22_NODE_8273_length_663_cov_0.978910_1_plen_65_part_10